MPVKAPSAYLDQTLRSPAVVPQAIFLADRSSYARRWWGNCICFIAE